jgi:hypothetical protein
MEKDVWIGPCVPIAEFYVAMRYVLYVMKNLYKLKSIVPFLYGIWCIGYMCGDTPFRAGGSRACLHIRTFMQQGLLKLGLMALIVYLKYVVCKTYF